MKKIFIDLGAYNGDTLALAMESHPDCDLYIGFEPYKPNFVALKERFGRHPKVTLIESAASVKGGKSELYLSRNVRSNPDELPVGNSLIRQKSNVVGNSVVVSSTDFAKYLEQFSADDYIIVKMDIEGEEYPLLKHLIATGIIAMIDKLYCEWHFAKIPTMPKKEHDDLVRDLNALGFDLTGNSRKDEFYRVSSI